ncbi:MAG TPA: hypothetical protein VJT73_17250 [Polyangiaceae bacterium]|nr:hypothetical protein [Polyangiaceae bacterium]
MKILVAAAMVLSVAALGLGFMAARMQPKSRARFAGPTVSAARGAETKSAMTQAVVRALGERATEPVPDEPDMARPEPASISGASTTGEPQTATEQRDATVSRLRASGPDRGRFVASLRRVTDEWPAVARELGVKFSEWECYAAGCFSDVSSAKQENAETLNDLVTRLESFQEWEGPKMRSGLTSAAHGGVEYTWFLFAPRRELAGGGGT